MTEQRVHPFVLSSASAASRKRARRFWGAMGIMMRYDDRRSTAAELRSRNPSDLFATHDDSARRAA